MAEDLTFCPNCGVKMRKSIAERIGVSSDSFSSIIGGMIIAFVLVSLAAIITWGLCSWSSESDRNALEMAKAGYVLKSIPTGKDGTGWRVSEWTKAEESKK